MPALEKINKNAMMNDIMKNGAALVVANILTRARQNKSLYDEDGLYGAFFFLVGLAFYHIVVVPVVPPLPQ